jgi:uncharacterized protein YvpB
MGVIIPSIPYKSQLDTDAGEFRNDCGPTSLAMILHAFGVEVSTNAVYRKTGAKANGYVSVSQLMRAGEAYNVPFDYFSGWTLDTLKARIKDGRPAIALVHYGEFVSIKPGVSTQYNFNGPHFLVVLGYDDDNIYVNDPLWSGSRRSQGEHKRWTYAQFKKAWGANSKDGNRNFSGIVSKRKLSTDAFGTSGTPVTPPPTFKVDPITHLRMKAWAAYFKIPLPEINNPAVANAYTTAMGNWGLRITMHKVTEVDTLGLLALKYYDDPLKWDVIAYFNGLGPGDTIHDNDVLIIPEPMEKPKAIPESAQPQGGTFEFPSGLNQ